MVVFFHVDKVLKYNCFPVWRCELLFSWNWL